MRIPNKAVIAIYVRQMKNENWTSHLTNGMHRLAAILLQNDNNKETRK